MVLFPFNLDGNAVVNVNSPIIADTSSWIDKDTDCTLSGTLTSPYFVPKVTSVVVEYDTLLSNSFGMYICVCVCCIYIYIYIFFF
jgi:hypothetical protein